MENTYTDAPVTLVDNQPLTPGQYALCIFLAGIPVVGIILLLVWAFGGNGNIHKENWAKGMLLIMLIGIIIGVLFFVLFGGLLTFSALMGD